MNKILLVILPVLSLLALLPLCAAAKETPSLSEDRFATLSTIQKLTDYEDYNVYSMEVLYPYVLENLLAQDGDDSQKLMELALREALPGVELSFTAPDFGCSAFTLPDSDGTVRFGRNYDFKLNTSCMIVRCHPEGGYASVAHAALNNLQADDPNASEASRLACLLSPFVCLDGINEKGVGIAVLTLDSEPVSQSTGKPLLGTSVLIRLVLDRAASTAEAVALLKEYDVFACSGRDYHFYITDSTGDSRIVEFDPESPARETVVTPVRTVTNFYGMYADKVQPNQRNGIYGHGKERWQAIEDVINAHNGIGNKETAWEALAAAAQEPNPESITSNTQWSIIYNLSDLSYELVFRRHWDTVHRLCLR